MIKKANAKINWIPYKKGGRQNLPSGKRYSTVAKFKDIESKWPNEAWSIVAEFIKTDKESFYSIVEIKFLAEEDAPQYLLYPGSKFELFEGRKLVAYGEVLPTE